MSFLDNTLKGFLNSFSLTDPWYLREKKKTCIQNLVLHRPVLFLADDTVNKILQLLHWQLKMQICGALIYLLAP